MTATRSAPVLLAAAVGLALAATAAWRPDLAPRLWAQAAGPAHDEHEGHDHDEESAGSKPDAHDEHDEHGEPDGHDEESGHAGHAHEDEAPAVKLTPRQVKTYGIELATAVAGTVSRQIRLPGEIVLNADRSAHIVPPAGGVVRAVRAHVGDRVQPGDVLAVLESAELSEAKTQYLVKRNEVNCCRVELDRAQAIHATTSRLLRLLDSRPSLDDLRTTGFADLSEGHGALVAAYAEVVFAQAEYEREKKLFDQKVSSRADFQTAENAYKKAYAQYVAAKSALAFETRRGLLEAQQSRQTTELEVAAAERKLRVLGLTGGEVLALQTALNVANARDCTDPNCATCQAVRAQLAETRHEEHGAEHAKETCPADCCGSLEDRLGVYSVRAPFDGTIIAKHAVLGEKLADDADLFALADLRTVWVDLSVYQKDLPHVAPGQAVRILAGAGVPAARGTIAYVSPTVDPTARTCLARVVLPNPDGRLRPGLFVTAELVVGADRADVLVPKDAVQRIGDEFVVFVPSAGGFEARPVTLGRRSATHVEVVSGLPAGARYVGKGAFELKAKVVTSGMDAHAGHGH